MMNTQTNTPIDIPMRPRVTVAFPPATNGWRIKTMQDRGEGGFDDVDGTCTRNFQRDKLAIC